MTNTKNWARARGLVRTNEVHGAEEFRVPTFTGFEHLDIARNEMQGERTVEVEDDGSFVDMGDVTETGTVTSLGFLSFCSAHQGVGLPLVPQASWLRSQLVLPEPRAFL